MIFREEYQAKVGILWALFPIVPLSWGFLLGEYCGRGHRLLPESFATALFLAHLYLCYPFGALKHGVRKKFGSDYLGFRELQVVSENWPQMLLETHPQLFTLGLSLCFIFISGWSQSWGIHQFSLSGFMFMFLFFKPISLFLRERKYTAPQVPGPLHGFKEIGPCNCKLSMKKTKPLAALLAEASRSAVMEEINESHC